MKVKSKSKSKILEMKLTDRGWLFSLPTYQNPGGLTSINYLLIFK